jgi:predicted O-methyltransferase YrrM
MKAMPSRDVLTADELSQIRNLDRILPSQPILSKYFNGDQAQFYRRLESLLHSLLPTRTLEEKWDLVGKPGVSYSSLGSDFNTLHFYQLLIRLGRYERVLELGTFIGVSTLFLAEAVGERGKVTSVELQQEFHDIAKINVERSGYAARVELLKGCVVETVTRLAQSGAKYDLVLMDAAKQSYGEMLEPALACLNPGGLVLVDDVFMNGDTLNPAPSLDKGEGVRAMLEKANAIEGVAKVILPIGNGLLLIHPHGARARTPRPRTEPLYRIAHPPRT